MIPRHKSYELEYHRPKPLEEFPRALPPSDAPYAPPHRRTTTIARARGIIPSCDGV
jgi:hypothetical protein